MPTLSSLGSAIMGIATTPSIDGSPVALMSGMPTSGRWDWISPTVAFGPLAPNFASTDFSLYTYNPVGPTLTFVDHYGANGTYAKAGGGNWACWVSDGRGVKTNLPSLGPFPLGYVFGVSRQGEFGLEVSLIADSGIAIYNATGTQIDAVSGTLPYNDRLFLREGIMSYALTGLGWRLRNYRTSTVLSFFSRTDGVDQCIPLTDGTDIWVLERNNVESLTLRKKDNTSGWLVQPPAANQYLYPDAIALSAGVARLAWSNTIGETAASLFVQDVTLATGANTLATVVAGALVFVPQAGLGTTTVPGVAIPASGGGFSPGGSGSPGKQVLAQRAAPPPAVKEQDTYPHVPLVKDYHTQQSLKLAWGKLAKHEHAVTTLQATVDAQATTITALQATVAELARKANVTYRGADDV